MSYPRRRKIEKEIRWVIYFPANLEYVCVPTKKLSPRCTQSTYLLKTSRFKRLCRKLAKRWRQTVDLYSELLKWNEKKKVCSRCWNANTHTHTQLLSSWKVNVRLWLNFDAPFRQHWDAVGPLPLAAGLFFQEWENIHSDPHRLARSLGSLVGETRF